MYFIVYCYCFIFSSFYLAYPEHSCLKRTFTSISFFIIGNFQFFLSDLLKYLIFIDNYCFFVFALNFNYKNLFPKFLFTSFYQFLAIIKSLCPYQHQPKYRLINP